MKKTYLISFIILAVLVVAAVNFYPQNMDKPGSEQFRGRMLDKLNLTDDQKEKIEGLRLKNQEEMIDLRAAVQKKELALKELQYKGNYSRSDYINLVKDISASKNKIAEARANHRMDVYELLTDQQKKIFDQMPMMRGMRGDGRGMGHDGRRMMGSRPPVDAPQTEQ